MKVKLEMVMELGEMDVGELATAVMREVRAMDIPNPDGGVMFLEHLSVVVKEVASSESLSELLTCPKSQTGDVERPPTPIGWSDTDWIKHLQDQEPHPLAGLHINQGSMDAAADAYEAEYNARLILQIEASREPHEPIWWEAVMEIQKLRAFASAVMRYWPYWPESDVDGGNLQDIAVRCGVLTTSIMFAPCGDNCLCADTISDDEFAEGITCYRKVDWLIGVDKE